MTKQKEKKSCDAFGLNYVFIDGIILYISHNYLPVTELFHQNGELLTVNTNKHLEHMYAMSELNKAVSTY